MPKNRTDLYGSDGLLQDTFEKSVKMSTYLVAFMVMDFTSRSTTTSSNVLVSTTVPFVYVFCSNVSWDMSINYHVIHHVTCVYHVICSDKRMVAS